MSELVIILIGGMWLFMMLIAGVMAAFDFIAHAFEPAFTQYERVSGGKDD